MVPRQILRRPDICCSWSLFPCGFEQAKAELVGGEDQAAGDEKKYSRSILFGSSTKLRNTTGTPSPTYPQHPKTVLRAFTACTVKHQQECSSG
jgi:hypothetical protein